MPTASSAPPRAVTKLRKPSISGTYPPFPAIISRHPPVSAAHPAPKTPAYYAEKLKECGGKEAGFREMEGGLLADLRVLLRNGVSRWVKFDVYLFFPGWVGADQVVNVKVDSSFDSLT